MALSISFAGLFRSLRHGAVSRRSLSRSVWLYNRQFSDATGHSGLAQTRLRGAGWDWAPVVLGGGGALIGVAGGGGVEDALTGSFVGSSVGFLISALQFAITRTD